MSNDSILIVLYPVLIKEDPTICGNYRALILLPFEFKVLAGVLCEQLQPLVKTLLDPIKCDFRSGKSTINQIFTLRQILELNHETQVDTQHVFVVYIGAFDSPIRDRVFAAISELDKPAKLIRLCNVCSIVKV